MNKKFLLITIFILCSTFLFACSNNTIIKEETDDFLKQKIQEGDFILTTYIDKNKLENEENPTLQASLEYIGEQDEIIITHASSPFTVSIEEKNSNISIPYGYLFSQNTTILKRNEPIERDLDISLPLKPEEFPEDYRELHTNEKYAIKPKLPSGEYTFTTYAKFTVGEDIHLLSIKTNFKRK